MTSASTPIQIESGLLVGVPARIPSITVYKGIPYGASTAGEKRWRAPQPPAEWDGVRTADTFGDICPQPGQPALFAMSEDCLNLNVWTDAAVDKPRPVLVWIHGGRFLFGHGSEPSYDGSVLANEGLVVVTINYRLGVFGFLASPELSAESGHRASGNYGLLDMLAALQWVQRNIAAFGGDPNRVTVAGQSGGGAAALALAYSPLAKDLFQQAIIESAALYPKDPAIATLSPSHRELGQAELDGVAFAKEHGAPTVAELRARSAEDLLVGSDVNDSSVPGDPGPPLFRPVVDRWVIPVSYWETISSGTQSRIAVIAGNNLDENGAKPQQHITVRDYERRARARYGEFADEFLSLYPATTDEEAGEQWNTSLREATRLSTFFWASQWKKAVDLPVYTYYWTHVPPGAATRGAYHGSEINYFFGNLHVADHDYTDEDLAVSARLSDYLVNFVQTGDPNGRGLPKWSPVDPTSATTMELGDDWRRMRLAPAASVDFFRRFFDIQTAW